MYDTMISIKADYVVFPSNGIYYNYNSTRTLSYHRYISEEEHLAKLIEESEEILEDLKQKLKSEIGSKEKDKSFIKKLIDRL